MRVCRNISGHPSSATHQVLSIILTKMAFSLEGSLVLKILLLLHFLILHLSAQPPPLNASQVKGPPWKVLFFGSDEFSLPTLVALTNEFKQSKKLISKLDLMFIDDDNVVWKHAYANRINRIAYPPEFGVEIRHHYDIGVLVSFGELLHDDLVVEFPLGILNAHPSLLPRWRGAAPIPHAIMNGDKETGVTIMKIKADEWDTGPIVTQTRTPIGPDETTPELYDRLSTESANLIMSLIQKLPQSVLKTRPQGKQNASYAPRLRQKMSWIVWKNWTSDMIYNRHRAIAHKWPVATIWRSFVVKFHNFTIRTGEDPPIDPAPKAFKKKEKIRVSEEGATVSHDATAAPHATVAPHAAEKKKLHNLMADPYPTKKKLHMLMAEPNTKKKGKSQMGSGFRKKQATKRPPRRERNKGPTTPEPTLGPEYDALSEYENLTDTHETPKQARARYVKEMYEPKPTRPPGMTPELLLHPGRVMFDKSIQALRVMCCDGAQLIVPTVTVSNRKTMNAASFHNGFLSRARPEDRIFTEYSHFIGKDATPNPWL